MRCSSFIDVHPTEAPLNYGHDWSHSRETCQTECFRSDLVGGPSLGSINHTRETAPFTFPTFKLYQPHQENSAFDKRPLKTFRLMVLNHETTIEKGIIDMQMRAHWVAASCALVSEWGFVIDESFLHWVILQSLGLLLRKKERRRKKEYYTCARWLSGAETVTPDLFIDSFRVCAPAFWFRLKSNESVVTGEKGLLFVKDTLFLLLLSGMCL